MYYHCTRKKSGGRCRQHVIRAEVLERQVLEFIESLTVMPRMHSLLLQELEANGRGRVREVDARLTLLAKEEANLARERSTLTTLRLRDLIDDAEFSNERSRIDRECLRVTEVMNAIDKGDWIEPARTLISGLKRITFWFQEGDPSARRRMIKAVGSNPILVDKKLSCEAKIPFLIGLGGAAYSIGCGRLDNVRTPTPRKRKPSSRECVANHRQRRQFLLYLQRLT
jgi:hypothetical protein